ncbi:MAG: ATP-binding protein [Thermodesulfovibrionales bacterium]|nr:ATP-binding protein [Thermodesulfovibrionales bacterium]
MKPYSNGLPLKLILLIPIIVLSLLTVVTIAYVSIKGCLKSADLAINNLLVEKTSAVKHNIRDLLKIPILVNEINQSAIKNGYLKLSDKKNREIYFYDQLRRFDAISYTFIGTPDGQFYGTRRNLKNEIEHVMRNDSTDGASLYFTAKEDGTAGVFVERFPKFDPRTRPWYKSAVQTGKPVWSPVYKHFVMPSLAITASHPVYDNKNNLIGVFGADLLLSNINIFLKDLQIGENGWIYIIDSDGYLVATSMDDTLFVKKGDEIKRVSATDSVNLKIRESVKTILSISKPLTKEIKINDELHYIHTDIIQDDYGIKWQIVICIPEKDFLNPVHETVRFTVFYSILILIILIVTALYVSSLITRPITRLAEIARNISYGKWEKVTDIGDFRYKEVNTLAKAFESMSKQLQISIENLDKIIKAKTQNLLETNEKLQEEIRQRKIIEEELVLAKEKAELANRAKSDFVAMISHEIRTPLNGIIGISSLLLNSNLTEEQKNNLNTIIYSGDILLNLINQVLDFSKLEAGKLEIEETRFNLYETCSKSIELMKAQARSKGLKVNLNYDEDTPKCYITDGSKIKQIIINLLGNALKFTDMGSITLNVSSKKIDEDVFDVKVSVVDTGIGIKEEDMGLLFKKFSQISIPEKGKISGTGLGLSISKAFVEMMGGKIGVESTYQKGSTFWFSLPLKICRFDCESCQKYKGVMTSDSAVFTGTKVLVVEDDRINQMVILKMLQNLGCDVTVANNGIEAINLLAESKYDVIFMDCLMPQMDGYETSMYIRNELKDDTYIIALTANVTEHDKKKCIESGMNDFVAKPINLQDIRDALKRWLDRRH